MYMPWLNLLDASIEIVFVQLPGRGVRILEKPYADISILLHDALTEIIPLIDGPYAFFGYSLGAKIAFELMLRLNEIGFPLPVHFMACASPAPHLPRKVAPIHALSDQEFIAKLSAYKGTPRELLENEEMMKIFLPVLRADFAILEKYRISRCDALGNKLSIFGGESDGEVALADLLAWETQFKFPARCTLFPGGHFFISESGTLLTDEINKILTA